jgi:hypothetical protein
VVIWVTAAVLGERRFVAGFAYAIEQHAADVTQNQAKRLGDYPNCSGECSSTTKKRCSSAIGWRNASTGSAKVLRRLRMRCCALFGNLQTMFHATADDQGGHRSRESVRRHVVGIAGVRESGTAPYGRDRSSVITCSSLFRPRRSSAPSGHPVARLSSFLRTTMPTGCRRHPAPWSPVQPPLVDHEDQINGHATLVLPLPRGCGERTLIGRPKVHPRYPAGGFLAFRFFPAIASTSKPKPASLSR